MTGAQLLAQWLTYLATEKRASPRTVRAYGDDVERYLDFLTIHRGETPTAAILGKLAAADLRAHLAARRGEGLGARSLARTLASIRNPDHVTQAALAGSDVVTVPPAVLRDLVKHPLTDKGLDAFLADWKKTGQKIA